MRFRRALPVLAAVGLAAFGTRSAQGAAAIHLPFPAGTAVSILQGYNGGTHGGVERYSLDLTRDDGKTSGSPALAPAPGTVVWSYPPGRGNGCVGIQIDAGTGLHEMLCHVLLNHAYANGEHVAGAQVLGTVGAAGTVGNNGVAHIHLQLYRVIDGSRTPVPYAAPDGAPLEGVSLPAGDGPDLWACKGGSGAGCHIVSQNSASGAPAPGGSTPRPGTITSAAADSSGGATLSSPRQQTNGLGVGAAVLVAGTGDCLRVHDQPATASNVVYCLPDGSQSVITDGPQAADGYNWYKLGDLGWSAADFLTVVNGGSSIATPPAGARAATPASAAATATLAAPAAATPRAGSGSPVGPPPPPPPLPGASATPTPAPAAATPAAPTPAAAITPELPVGVAFSVGDNVTVTGAGDCVNVHDQPALSGNVVDCLPDGTTGSVTDGPVQADGYAWYRLDTRGWLVSAFLGAQ